MLFYKEDEDENFVEKTEDEIIELFYQVNDVYSNRSSF